MNCSDADMMEAEATPQPVASSADPNDVRNLLTMARQLIDQGKPSQALQAVVMAMKMQGGEEAVSLALNRAREMYINKVQANSAAEELASLFAECAIAEAIPLQPGLSLQHKIDDHPIEPDPRGTSILAETGRKQVVLDAFSDGSSFVCLRCGGLAHSWEIYSTILLYINPASGVIEACSSSRREHDLKNDIRKAFVTVWLGFLRSLVLGTFFLSGFNSFSGRLVSSCFLMAAQLTFLVVLGGASTRPSFTSFVLPYRGCALRL
ncbi:hypothetical protein PHJA_000595300 [Phtheirospermum japonicum]|uniref:C2HC zinc finger plants domain-containing protein n=1 Tax=Phtheirospermum japonicum TaxID=374723 RepID=A0A830BIG3_9LAMI|nr:hypothetical protein PHJA_000595300 [Phtheirospermum japonicum]